MLVFKSVVWFRGLNVLQFTNALLFGGEANVKDLLTAGGRVTTPYAECRG